MRRLERIFLETIAHKRGGGKFGGACLPPGKFGGRFSLGVGSWSFQLKLWSPASYYRTQTKPPVWGLSSFCWVGVISENCTLRISLGIQEGQLRLVERTNLLWTSSYYLMLLQCFWIPDFYLSALGHPHVMTFIPRLHVFCLPWFFFKRFSTHNPTQKKTLPKWSWV